MRIATFLLVTSASCILACHSPLRAQTSTNGGTRVVDLDLSRLKRVDVSLPSSRSTPTPVRIGQRATGWVTRLPGIDAPVGNEQFLLLPVPAPVVHEGRLYAGGGFHGRELSALDARTGRELWRTHLEDNGPSTPHVSRRSVVVNTESCTTFRLDPVSGTPRWKRRLGPSIQGNPTVVGDRVYTAARLEQEGYALFALSHDSGDVVWQSPIERDIVDEPVVRGDHIFVTNEANQVQCFDQGGRSVWRTDVPASSAPCLDGHALYVAYAQDHVLELRCLDVNTGELLWEAKPELSKPRDAQRTGLVTTTQASRFPRIHPWGWGDERPRPVLVKGRALIAFGQDVFAFETRRGQLIAHYRLPNEYAFYAPPAVHDDDLVYATLDGLLIEIDPTNGKVERAVDLGVRVTSHPVIDEGRVYVTSWDLVYGIAWK
ncbi:MAG: PQQ-binding-like beta-propeller repeat protein [Planctomycetes bacterium]|nr:PQQ-binding-like beta-propeller repeat protein [Planctomycetota bacterium]MCB9891814.1 PQQ-binding-like beta-propeller repeat protein [Planctomycetota bacterium]